MSLYEITQSDRINKNVNLYVNSINTAEGASGIIHTSKLILTSASGITVASPATTINLKKPLVLENNLSDISTTSQLNCYSVGSFSTTFGGGSLTPTAAKNVSYTRIGQFVNLNVPSFTLTLNGTPTLLRNLSDLPVELQSTASDYPSTPVCARGTGGGGALVLKCYLDTSLNRLYYALNFDAGLSTADGITVEVAAHQLAYFVPQ